MSMMGFDPRASDLIDALKGDRENFILSNHIFKKQSALKSVYEYYRLRERLFECARDPSAGMQALGPRPIPPTQEQLRDASDEEKALIEADYSQMLKLWEDQRRAMEMHIPFADLMMIERYLEPFSRTFAATSAVKGLRFKAFTKDVEHQEPGMLGGLLKRGQPQN